MKKQTTVTILGSTGSVGRQVLDVISRYPERFKVVGLSCYSNTALLRQQIDKFNPTHYFSPEGSVEVQTSLFDFMDDSAKEEFSTKCLGSLSELAEIESDIVVSCVSGVQGLLPALTALQRGATLAIANKEAIVAGGRHLNAAAKKSGAKIIPVDSEHSAIWRCLEGEGKEKVKNLVLTASGGAFRDFTADELKKVSAKEALNHPVWHMGKKVTIDSATLFNKGLEIIEAKHLFDMSVKNIKVVQHRESIVHSLVEFNDNSMKALLSAPDMRLAIESALFYPEMGNACIPSLDLSKVGTLHFEEPDTTRFPCLAIGRAAGESGDGAAIAVSAADEILVENFLKGNVGFTDIPRMLEKVLKRFEKVGDVDFDDIFRIDNEARKYTYSMGVK